jgi:tRNA(Ile)-lysidine synthetase-like protein
LFKTCELKCEKIHGKLVCTGPREGDRFHPSHRGCGKSLRVLFREAGLTRGEATRIPVLRDEEGILAVPGFGQDVRCAAACGDSVIRVTWTEDAE